MQTRTRAERTSARSRAVALGLASIVVAALMAGTAIGPAQAESTPSPTPSSSSETPFEATQLADSLASDARASAQANSVEERQATAAASTSGWLHTSGGQIRTRAGSGYTIKATSWSGIETGTCLLDGLDKLSLEAGLAQIKAMGFNTVRLPFASACLKLSKFKGYASKSLNPTIVGKSPQKVMDIVISKAKSAGLNIILDRHRGRISTTAKPVAPPEFWYEPGYSEAAWIAEWKKLAKRYKSATNVIGVDLQNEPHGRACWGCGDPKLDWQKAATKAGNAILSVNRNLLIVVEGVGVQPDGDNTWWGAALEGVATAPVKLTVPARVVYSPHEYPSSVSDQPWFHASDYPANLPGVWNENWGFIRQQGIAPILVGEFGSKLETQSDRVWLKSFVSYLKSNGMSFGFWTFNPNSGDTGGLLADNWKTVKTTKLTYLKPLGMKIPPKPVKPMTGKWTLNTSWNGGYVASIMIKGGSKSGTWTVTWKDKGVTKVVKSWGMKCTVKKKKSVTCKGYDYGKKIGPGVSFNAGAEVHSSAKAPKKPTLKFTVKG